MAAPTNQPHAAQIASIINSEGAGYLSIDQILPQQLVDAFSKAQATNITESKSAASLAFAVKAYGPRCGAPATRATSPPPL